MLHDDYWEPGDGHWGDDDFGGHDHGHDHGFGPGGAIHFGGDHADAVTAAAHLDALNHSQASPLHDAAHTPDTAAGVVPSLTFGCGAPQHWEGMHGRIDRSYDGYTWETCN